MNNRNITDTRAYNKAHPSPIKEIEASMYAASRGDTEVDTIHGEEAYLSPEELQLLYLAEDLGDRKIAEDLIAATGAGYDAGDGKKGYQQNVAGTLSSIASVGKLMSTTATQGSFLAGAGSSIAAFAGPAAIIAGVTSMWKGANDAAAANRAKMKELGKGIEKINAKRVQLGERAVEDIQNIWEGVGSKLSDIRYGIGETFENVSDKVGSVIQRGKGLATGDAEQMVAETSTNVQENLTRQTESLEEGAGKQIDAYGRQMEDETDSMTMEIEDMQGQIGELSKKSKGWQNIL